MKDFVWYFRRRTILFACLNIHLELRLWSVWFDLRWGVRASFFLEIIFEKGVEKNISIEPFKKAYYEFLIG